MALELAVSVLRVAIMLRGRPARTIFRSERGGQFRAKNRAMTLLNNGLFGSVGQNTSAGYNAPMELRQIHPNPT